MKDVASFLKVAVNPHDEMAFKRIIKLLAGGGAARNADKLWEKFHPMLAEGQPLQLTSDAVPKKAVDDWKKAAQALNEIRGLAAGSAGSILGTAHGCRAAAKKPRG